MAGARPRSNFANMRRRRRTQLLNFDAGVWFLLRNSRTGVRKESNTGAEV